MKKNPSQIYSNTKIPSGIKEDKYFMNQNQDIQRELNMNSKKIYELSQIKENNEKRFKNIMNKITQPFPIDHRKYNSGNVGLVEVPDSVKWDFDDKGQQAIEELQQFFSRESACSLEDEESELEEETPEMKFKVVKMGFEKPINTENPSTTENNNQYKFELSDFQILHTLGKGSSGVVKLAKHKKKN